MPAPKHIYLPYSKRISRRWLIGLGVLLVIFAIGVVCGRFLLAGAGRAVLIKTEQLSRSLDKISGQNQELKRQITIFENASRVDRMAMENIQTDLLALQEKLSTADKELEFYHRIISPDNRDSDLQIERFRMFDDSGLKYVVTLSQGIAKNSSIKGRIQIEFSGKVNGEEQVLALQETDSEGRRELVFSFRYFQSIVGGIDWPDGFVLDSVLVRAKAQTRGAVEVSKAWSAEQLETTTETPGA